MRPSDMPRISVIVTTYQRPRALDRVLASLADQEVAPNEIIIADDGSGPETSALVSTWQARLSCPLLHVWQADEGFRAAGARNRAVAASSGEYLIFLDGDCLVFPDFIRRHLALAEAGRLVMGSRILCSSALTEQIENGALGNEALAPLSWRWPDWLGARKRGDVNRLLPLLRLPGQAWRKLRGLRWRGIRTFNLAVWRSDFERVNGFDELFQGWGHEDADLAVRLMHAGVRRKDGQFALPVLHLWHRESDRGRESENMKRLQARIQSGQVRAEAGLDGYTKAQP
ncbi:MAG: glycosyltransferase [Nitrosomonadales bacterium]|nr:MAG: glycosyltransferase [Nitrosomonadales bacterium]